MTKEERIAAEIGCVADSIDNLLSALTLPLPDRLHLAGVRGSLPDLRDRLMRVYDGLSEVTR